jgi:hypothetical protein
MNLARIHRLLQRIGLLQVGRGYNAESLALECGLSSLLHGSPYRMFFSRRIWYVLGRLSLHRAKPTFHLGRIIEIKTLDDHFQIPRGFSIERYLSNARL